MERFSEYLKSNGILGLTEVADLIQKSVSVMQSFQAPAILLRGIAGTGKTTIAEMYAKYSGSQFFFIQCTPGIDESELLYNIVPSSNTKSGFKLTDGVIVQAVKSSINSKTVLVIDEVDKSRPKTDSFFLDLNQNCRVNSVSENKPITGNKENLVVFFTSNDTREFSEPFLRRAVSIRLNPISAKQVLDLMLKHFPQKIAVLLAQVYDDTIKAGLIKPATVQELLVAGRLLTQGIDLETVIKVAIIKYEEDYQKFITYIRSRKPYAFMQNIKDEEEIVDCYEAEDSDVKIEENESAKNNKKILPERVPSIVVKKVQEPERNPEDFTNKDIEVCGKFVNDDDVAYTAIIKLQRPEPSDDPCVLGGGRYKLLKEYEKEFLVSTKPFSVWEILKSFPGTIESEIYVEDICFVTSDFVDEFIKRCDKIKYYTKNVIIGEYNNAKIMVKILDSKTFAHNTVYKVEMKASGSGRNIQQFLSLIGSLFIFEEEYYGDSLYEFNKRLIRTLLSSNNANYVFNLEGCYNNYRIRKTNINTYEIAFGWKIKDVIKQKNIVINNLNDLERFILEYLRG